MLPQSTWVATCIPTYLPQIVHVALDFENPAPLSQCPQRLQVLARWCSRLDVEHLLNCQLQCHTVDARYLLDLPPKVPSHIQDCPAVAAVVTQLGP